MPRADETPLSEFVKKLLHYTSRLFLASVALICVLIAIFIVWMSIEDYKDDKQFLLISPSLIPADIKVFKPRYIEEPNDWDGSFSILMDLDKETLERLSNEGLSFLNDKRIGLSGKGNEIPYDVWRSTPVIVPEYCFSPTGCQGKENAICKNVKKVLQSTGGYYTFSEKCTGIVISPDDGTVLVWFTHT